MVEKTGPTVEESGDENLIQRVRKHLGKDALKLTKDQIAHYLDGGHYGGVPDPRSLAAHRAHGQTTSAGGSGPEPKKES